MFGIKWVVIYLLNIYIKLYYFVNNILFVIKVYE